MKHFTILLLCSFFLYAKEVAHFHKHHDKTMIKFNTEHRTFQHSKKKEQGYLYGIELDSAFLAHHLQLYYEKTKTQTKPIVPKDLDIDKIALQYRYNEFFTFHYLHIADNLVSEAKNSSIFGVGIGDKLRFDSYLSLYKNFKVYQNDLSFRFQTKLFERKIFGVFFGKYIYIDKQNALFAKNAKRNYLPLGVKLHTHYKQFHFGVAGIFGKRVFTILHDGLKVQHHAMEFDYSVMGGFGVSFLKRNSVTLRYSYHKAKELPENNAGVIIQNYALEYRYKF